MLYELREIVYVGCLVSIIDKIFKSDFSEHRYQRHKQILIIAVVLFYQIRQLAAIWLCFFLIDKMFHVNSPEYRLHKRILAIAASNKDDHDPGVGGPKNKAKPYNSLTLSETDSTTQHCFKLISDVLCSPHRHIHNLSLTRNVMLESAKILSDGLSSPNNSSLESLNISCNRYVTNDAWKLIAEALSPKNYVSSTLRYLQLHGNGIDAVGAKLISGILRDNSFIEFLNLRDNAIGDEGIAFIAEALSPLSSSNKSLVRLDVGRNFITESGIRAICQMLMKNNTLQHLSLETSCLNDQACEFIAEVIKKSTTLRTLNLQNNSITIPGAQSIAKALGDSNSKLTEINLSSNRSMGEDGIEAVAKALSKNNDNDANRTLQILRLDGNIIRLQAASAVQNMITFNSTLVQLNLRSCSIYDEAIELISNALLAPTCSLQNLNLQGNRIGVVGARHLGKALAKNTSLNMLNLAFNNSFGVQGVLELGEGLHGNSTLKVLNLAFSFNCPNDLIGGGGQDDDGDSNRVEECTIAQTLSRALFFPPSSKNNKNDSTTIERRYPFHPRYEDIVDQRVGWSSNLLDTNLPLDIFSSATICNTSAEYLNSNNITIGSMSRCLCEKYRTSSVYGWTTYADQKDTKKQFPLYTAVQCNLKWRNGIQKLLEANYQAMEEEDAQTGLLPFMTAAVGDNSDWESVHRLLQQNPGIMVSYVLDT